MRASITAMTEPLVTVRVFTLERVPLVDWPEWRRAHPEPLRAWVTPPTEAVVLEVVHVE